MADKKIERKDIAYTGLFVKDIPKLLEQFPPKHPRVFAHHSTITGGGSLDGIEVGKECSIKIIGRVFDDKGDALLVENPKSTSKYPHITLSCAEGTKPVYSFQMIQHADRLGIIDYFDSPITVNVTEGYSNGPQDFIEKGIYEITDKKK